MATSGWAKRIPVRVARLTLLAATIFGLAWAVLGVASALRIATASISHTLCSQTFISRLNPDDVYAETVKPWPGLRLVSWAARYHIDRVRQAVVVTLAGVLKGRSEFKDGYGCIVVRDGESPIRDVPASEGQSAQELPVALPDIAGPAAVEPAEEGLRTALARAFSEPEEPPYRRVKAIVILHRGRVVAERYAPGYPIDTALAGYSVTKSVMNALIGILVREQRLSVADRAPVAAWSKADDPRHAITIDELLRMTSGLALDEAEGFGAPDTVSRMLYGERDMAGFAEGARLKDDPGTRWSYSSGNSIILSRILRDAVGGHATDVIGFMQRELFAPLGMRNVTFELDATATPVGSKGMFASARDWARFGLLYLNDGVVGGRRILPPGWVAYSSSPTLDTDYGAGFWTNAATNNAATGRIRGGMPPDAFYASGNLGQRVVIVPSMRLVVVRLGVSQDWPDFDMKGFVRLISDTIAALKRSP